jgi:hypothetical protein
VAETLRGGIVPPIVVSENRKGTERRLEATHHVGEIAHRDGAGDEAVPGRVIAEQEDEIGLERVRGVHDSRHAIERHVGLAPMHVGDDRDRQVQIGGPLRRVGSVTRHREPMARFDPDRVGAGCRKSKGRADEPFQESASARPVSHGRLADQRFLAQDGGQGALGGAALGRLRHVNGGGEGRERERLETGIQARLLAGALAIGARLVVELGGLAHGSFPLEQDQAWLERRLVCVASPRIMAMLVTAFRQTDDHSLACRHPGGRCLSGG